MLSRSQLHRVRTVVPVRAVAACAFVALGACAGDATSPRVGAGATLQITTTLQPLDTVREGRYVAWVIDGTGTATRLGVITPGIAQSFLNPADGAASIEIRLELPGVLGSRPSDRVILRGDFMNRHPTLSIAGAVTQEGELRPRPGQFTMFTPSNNDVGGYPSREEAGVWLFNMKPSETEQNDFYVRLTQLQNGWTYEGWMVRDLGSANEIWLSYGKFLPDWTGAANQPDDTGWGPFSGVADYWNSRLEDFPGDDWISNPLKLPFPQQLQLPLDLREKDASGKLRWTHVITIEPMSDKGEAIGSERPFGIRPYVDPFGDLRAGDPRTISFHPENVPSGEVVVR